MGDTAGDGLETVRVSPDPDIGIPSIEEHHSQNVAEVDVEGSAQYDSYKTHITETQLQEFDLVPEQFPSQLSEDVRQDANQAASPKPSSQLPAMIAKRFARPISSHEDPTKAFTFGKAAPPPKLNFGRNMNQHASLSNSHGPAPPSVKTSEMFDLHRNIDDMGIVVATHVTSCMSAKDHLATNTEVQGSLPLQPEETAGTENGMSFPHPPNAANGDCARIPEPTMEHASQNINPEEIPLNARSDGLNSAVSQPKSAQKGSFSEAVHAQDVVRGSVQGSPSPPSKIVSPCTRLEKLDYAHTLQQIVQPLQVRGPPRSPSNRVLTPSRGNSVLGDVDGDDMIRRGGFSHTPTRVTKTRKKSKPILITDAVDATFPSAGIQANLSDEQLVRLLLSRYKGEQEQRRAERARYQEKVSEAKGLREAADTLYHRLQETREREDAQKTEISKYRMILPKWEAKIRKLTSSVKGLHTDHQNLQVDAQAIQEQQRDIVASKCDIEDSLRDARHSAKQGNTEAKRLLRDARHRVDILEQTIEHQEMQLQEDSDLINTERERSQRLEQDIKKIADSHQQLTHLFTEERQNLAEKMDGVISNSMSMDVGTSAHTQAQIKATLDRCLNFLQDLDVAEIVRPRDLQEMSASMNSYAKKLSRSLEIYAEKVNATEMEQAAFITKIEHQLSALGENIMTEHENAVRVSDLQEIKATIKERLRMTEAALAEARRDAIAQGVKEQRLQQKIMTLETEVTALRNIPAKVPQVDQRTQELESQNSELLAAIEAARLRALQVSESHRTEILELQTNINELRTQRGEALAEITKLNEEKSRLAAEAELQLEETRKQLAKAANIEQTRLTGQHVNSIRQLRQQLEDLQTRVAELRPLQEEKCYIQAKAEQDSRQHADEMRRIVQENKTIQAKSDEYMQQMIDLQLEKEASEMRMREQHEELKDLQQQKEVEDVKTNAKINQLQQENDHLHSQIKSSSTPARQPEVREALQTPSRDRADLAKSEIERARQGQKLAEVEEQLRVMTDRLHSSDVQIQVLQEQARVREEFVIAEPVASPTPDKPRRKANRNARPSSEQQTAQSITSSYDTSESPRPEEVSLLASATRRIEPSGVQPVLPLSHFSQEIPDRSTTPFPDWEGLFPPTPSQFGGESRELTTYETQRSRMTSSSQEFGVRDSQESKSTSSQERFVPRSRDGKGESQELMTSKSQELLTTSTLRDVVRDEPVGRITFPRQSISRTNDSPRLMSKEQTTSSSTGIIPRRQGRMLPNLGAGNISLSSSTWQPKSILKPTKRDATTAGLPVAGTMNGKPKVIKGDKGLGPVIVDSQLPFQNIPRNQRQIRTLRRSTKDHRMTRRFSQELE